jgi:hypothetical protein
LKTIWYSSGYCIRRPPQRREGRVREESADRRTLRLPRKGKKALKPWKGGGPNHPAIHPDVTGSNKRPNVDGGYPLSMTYSREKVRSGYGSQTTFFVI